MIFLLEPYCGHSGTYLDIKFSVKFEKSEKAEIQIINRTTNEFLNILSTSKGVIKNENLVVLVNSDSTEGYINLFNHDKLNQEFEKYSMVEIECKLRRCRGDKIVEESDSVEFFNESKSLDSEIAPFDLVIYNKKFDFGHDSSLRLSIFTDIEKKYEIAFKSTTGKLLYIAEVLSKPGRCDFEIPAEVLLHHCGSSNRFRKCLIYFIKFEGILPGKQANRKFVPLKNQEISLEGEFMLSPQQRKGPDGKDIPDTFVLSDRYFVHTYKGFSSFGTRKENIQALCNWARLLQESQSMKEMAKNNTAENQQSVQNTKILRKQDYSRNNSKYFRHFNSNFNERNFLVKTSGESVKRKTRTTETISQPLQKNHDCGCSRKK